jgi:transporter family-2 protein
MPLQAGVNAQLSRWVGSPSAAARSSRSRSARSGSSRTARRCCERLARVERALAPLRRLGGCGSGGLLGAVFVTAAATLAPRLGAATFISLTIAGQMLVSILLDQFGLVGFAARPATPLRLLGALLLVAGVLLIRKF